MLLLFLLLFDGPGDRLRNRLRKEGGIIKLRGRYDELQNEPCTLPSWPTIQGIVRFALIPHSEYKKNNPSAENLNINWNKMSIYN